jgi:acyl-ACP thioesterase
MSVSQHDFKIHSFDTDAFGLLTTPGLLGYLLEAAGRSADSLGFGITKLQNESGLTWVIARIKIVLTEALRFLEDIQVHTWPSGLMRSAAMRDFRIYKGDREVGKATSSWFVLDMESRFPVRPHDIFPESLRPETEHLVTLSRSIPSLKESPDVERQFHVRFADIDLNQHVTAASYVAWAMEALPETLWNSHRLESLDIQFLEECHLGDEIITGSREFAPSQRVHRIARASDNKELTRLITTWVPRENV